MAELSYYGVGNQSNWNTPVEPEKPPPQVPQSPLIPPELQSIIDKVSGSSMSVGRKGSLLTSLGGVVGGLEQQRRTEEGTTPRFGITEASKAKEFDVSGQLKKEGLGIEQQKVDLEKAGTPGWLQKAIMKKLGLQTSAEVSDISSKGIGGYSGKPTSSLTPEEYDKWLSNF